MVATALSAGRSDRAAGPLTVMFVHGPTNVGGDTTALLSFLAGVDLAHVNPIIVATPNCEAWARLSAVAAHRRLRIVPVDMGVTDTEEGAQRKSAVAQAASVALGLAKLVEIGLKEKVDIIYTLDRSRSPLLAAAAARLLRRSLLFHAHYPYYPRTHLAGRSVVRSAARVIAVSDFVREAYLRFGVSADRITTVHNGIDVEAYASRERCHTETSNAPGTSTVLLPGRLSRYKGQLELIEAMPTVLAAFPATRFVLAGYDSPETGDLAGEAPTVLPILQRRASDLGVADHVEFLGMTRDMAAQYAAADVVVVPTWEEPFGLVVLEAMAAERAIVASAGGGIPEIIASEQTGILVPPRDPSSLADAIKRLLADGELRAHLAGAALTVVRERFSIERYCRDFEATLLAVGGRGCPHA